MPTFQYEAMDNTGLEIKETIEAATEAEATAAIREKGFYVTKITEKDRKKKKKDAAKGGAAGSKKKGPQAKKTFTIGGVGAKQLTAFTRQLSTLQDAGLPILRSLRILEGQSKPGALKNSLMGVIEDIEGGATLSEAMSKQPKAFDHLYVNMVKAGEAGGALELILQRLADFKERSQSLKKRVQGAMIYPACVITVASLIVFFIMYWIIPKFKAIFEGFGTELPGMTVALINTSDFVVTYFYLLPAIPFAFWLFIKIVKKNKTGAYIVDWISLRIPLLGKIIEKATVARLCRTLGTLIGAGVPILEAILIARDTAGNAVFKRAFDNIYAAIREGESMAVPLKESRIVDDIVVNMVDVGEETGALDNMLYKVADVYDEEVQTLVDGLIKMLEPLMVVALGLIVGFIVIALFLPLIKLLNDLS
ncbi:type II secretion system F family protein [Stratiformator vulcanicus]|uniref:Type II secretion system protein F n=1 Tax=Stratiformator vulcanicus TaxID=2527980 RepID=A0A517R0V1_9PLAN|nr:type II secretion system F family protein [Stratiformator vulcanicus]QDT37532.1 Type II secretion system protein F [Stratiformator vulcanicus]